MLMGRVFRALTPILPARAYNWNHADAPDFRARGTEPHNLAALLTQISDPDRPSFASLISPHAHISHSPSPHPPPPPFPWYYSCPPLPNLFLLVTLILRNPGGHGIRLLVLGSCQNLAHTILGRIELTANSQDLEGLNLISLFIASSTSGSVSKGWGDGEDI